MRFKITYMVPNGPLVVKTNGAMNATDYLAMADALLRDPRRIPGGSVIFDHTALEFIGVDATVLERIRAFHISHEHEIGDGRSAIVVKPGLSREWHKLWAQGTKIKTGNKVSVFENLDDAARWTR